MHPLISIPVITFFLSARVSLLAMEWKNVPDESLALEDNGKVILQFHYGKSAPKPFFHPLRTVDGHELTWLRPDDHPWHLGLWFSWKYINGKNYWESDRATGKSEGTTEVMASKVTSTRGGPASVDLRISYHLPDGPEVMGEKRVVTIHPPEADGTYRIDWTQVFTAAGEKVVLDRTPPKQAGGPSWGGYAGLAFRSAASMTGRVAMDSNGFTQSEKIMGSGKTAAWMDLSGTVGEAGKASAGVTIFDHPSNPNHPNPWYLYLDGKFGAIKSAPVYAEPITLEAGATFTLRYRVLIHPGMGKPAVLDDEFQRYRATNP